MRLVVVFFSVVCSLLAQDKFPIRFVEIDGRVVAYTIQDGLAVTQGDIILGPAANFELGRTANFEPSLNAEARPRPASIAGTYARQWTDKTMYYTIDSDTPAQQNLLDAIAYWNNKPPFKILPRTNEPNYVRFKKIVTDAACNSSVGMVGGEQSIGVTAGCSVGSAIHELGHAWGLLHEQVRADRGAYITVLYENIDKRYLGNFNQGLFTADYGYYDHDSIMHYGAAGFTRNFQDSMETVPVGIPLGQRTKLSAGDYDAVQRLYGVVPAETVITTIPEGLPVVVDGKPVTSPQSFNWAEGSVHSVSVTGVQGSSPRYVFARWSDGGGLSHDITASDNTTVFAAVFARHLGVQTGVQSGQGTTSIFPLPVNGYLPDRSPFLVTATPAPGSSFTRWSGSTNLQANGSSVSNTAARLEPTGGALNFQAGFTGAPISTVDSDPRGALVVIDGAGYYTPVNFAWANGSTHTLSVNSPQFQGTNTTRFTFLQWEDGGTGNRTVKVDANAATYTVKFNKQFLLTTAPIGSGNVSLSPASADGFYDAGTTVQVNAVPTAGQTLRYWLGDLVGATAETSVVVDQDKYLIANFGTQLPWLAYNSASFALNPIPLNTGQTVAPGELISIFGAGIGPAVAQTPVLGPDGKVPTSVAGVSVAFDNFKAPITFAGPNQINVVVPFGIAGQTTTTVAIANSLPPSRFTINVAASVPGLFTYNGTGRGPVAALNQDGSLNSEANPAAPGSIVVLYATGAGVWNKPVADGLLIGTDLAYPAAPVFARFGKLDAQIQYAGTAPYLVNGALQMNVVVPPETLSGEVPLQIIVGRYTSAPGTTVWVK